MNQDSLAHDLRQHLHDLHARGHRVAAARVPGEGDTDDGTQL
jgi:hypothetical protein